MHAPKTVSIIILDILTVAFQGAAFIIVGTTDKCAPLGKAMDPSIPFIALSPIPGSTEDDVVVVEGPMPVSSFGSCSPISFLLFSWISPVLATGAKVVSLSVTDLPLLGANDRAGNLYDKITQETGKGGPTWINPLLWRCLKTNRRMFYWRESVELAWEGWILTMVSFSRVESVLALVTSFL